MTRKRFGAWDLVIGILLIAIIIDTGEHDEVDSII